MVTLAEMCPGMAVFFNGARAGASAPDHLHFQAVSANELPLLRLLEERHPENLDGILTTRELDINLPFGVYSAVIPGGEKGLQILKSILAAQGIDNITGNPDSGLVNTFFWVSRQGGKMRVLVIPRGGHRPEKYGRREDEYLVSPGAVDMAGVLILPREKDFDSLTSDDIIDIYRQTGVSPDKL